MAGGEGGRELRANVSQRFKTGHERRQGRRERGTNELRERKKAIRQRPKQSCKRKKREKCASLHPNSISKRRQDRQRS